MAGLLRLEAQEFRDLTRWRWVLTGEDPGEAFITDHQARLDPASWHFEAFTDLAEYLSWNVAPDRRQVDEARIVAELGEWIGSRVLGPAIASELASRSPATVRVVIPAEAMELAFRPLELAHAGGRPLAVQGVTLVMQPGPDGADQPTGIPAGGRLRMLGLFSLPDGRQPLNLRRERNSLVTLMREITAAGKAADARVLQYGVTRQALRDVLADSEGWDIIHISGHGVAGDLVLETDTGTPDPVSAADLGDMLALARGRVKLVTISACRSATGLASRLDCAVLAMRYPVADEFTSELCGTLYDLLADKGQPLPRALGTALRDLLAKPGGAEHPALSVATPALFGAQAVGLRLAAPERDGAEREPGPLTLAGFPPPPERFIGRARAMARASAALATRSRVPGVLLHGMPGGGKTACALEVAYAHDHAFDRLAWYQAPDEGSEIGSALTDFALTLERQLPGFRMARALASPDQLTAFLPELTSVMARQRLLLVIDNADSLIAGDGQWRDDGWRRVITALTGHDGLGRLIVTSRRVPAGLTRLEIVPVAALSPDEALVLARELPHLRTLMNGQVPGIESHVARRLGRRVLEIAHGHPRLLELANGQAARPGRLTALVTADDQTWRARGGVPNGLFADESGTAPTADYLQVLTAWAEAAAGALSPGERDLFWFLCCLEEPDRERFILAETWPELWRGLGRDGQSPGVGEALAAVAVQGLIAIQDQTPHAPESYAVHPGIAAAGRNQAGQSFRDCADTQAVAFWAAVYAQASGMGGDGAARTDLLARAALAAVPYLARQQEWDGAVILLEDAVTQNSMGNVTAALPAIRQIIRQAPHKADALALLLGAGDQARREALTRAAMRAALGRGDYRKAAGLARRLADECLKAGRLAEALALSEQVADYARQAGLGPWTQLSAEATRLQVLVLRGQARQVLDEVTRLRADLGTLPPPDPDEAITPWDVREGLLYAGRAAAVRLGWWGEALGLNASILASLHDRDAPPDLIARARINDYGPLMELEGDNTDLALALVQQCLAAFRATHNIHGIGSAFAALASIEDRRGHGDAALRFQRDALRYHYLADDILGTAVSYHNYGNYLRNHIRQPAPAIASHLAAALINTLAGSGDYADSVRGAAADLLEFGDAAAPPRDVAGLCRLLADISGTDLPGLLATLSPDPDAVGQALRDLIAQAREVTAAHASAADPAEGGRWQWAENPGNRRRRGARWRWPPRRAT